MMTPRGIVKRASAGEPRPASGVCQGRSVAAMNAGTGGGVPRGLNCASDKYGGVSATENSEGKSQNFSGLEKVCSKCGLAKPRTLAAFPSDARRADGLRADCRVCFSAVRLARYAALRGDDYSPSPSRRGIIRPRKQGGYIAQTVEAAAAQRDKHEATPGARLKRRLRERIRRALGPTPKGHYSLGCTAAELRVHIERQFVKGMSWANRSDWHVDHIRPLASFDTTDPEQIRAACHFTNLRPLWAEDNLRKGATIEVLI